MSSSYDRFERNVRGPTQNSRRGTLTYWLPLALTVTAATVGIVTWIWSERSDDDDDEAGPEYTGDHIQPGYGRNPDGSVRAGPPSYADLRPGEAAYGTTPQGQTEESASYMARMSGALRRTPSPQQIFDGVSRSAVAGVAAAGAAVGSALSSIREKDEHAYKDHETWSEEAEARRAGASPGPSQVISSQPGVLPTQRAPTNTGNGRRKTVAVVISADNEAARLEFDEGFHHEHASILSHLPHNTDFSKIRLFVLIYAPGLKEHPLDVSTPRPAGSLGSSFENIGHDQAQTPGEEMDRSFTSSENPVFNTLYSEALGLVEKESMVLPFTTPSGHVHMLRHLSPEIVYLQESLSGNDGNVITQLQSWLRHDVVLVVGADGGHGGLADSESEAEQGDKEHHWWQREERVGRGRGVIVVEGLRVGDDWARRVESRE